ncbi:molybdopterin molybdotransferase MoeA [Paenibacillus aestuarii]|uniref:Molybdopterin molybdenumtransferase n=1 Tax=Paenibacillus aestuarii TaxID=516965 RepID=A0ABW0KFH3_9BACL|nr:gephyrin-like molybdotransferase Glp [Paenibacillus aestuarii]
MSSESKLKFGRDVISVEDARTRLYPHAAKMAIEYVPLTQAFGRRLAVDVYADHPVPHFRRSGVDGYAVRTADIRHAAPESPVSLEVIERIPSGTMPKLTVGAGQAARIMTGAPVPDGADCVVMLEMTDSLQDAGAGAVGGADAAGSGAGTNVSIKKNLPTGSNITPIAGEITAGELLLPRGSLLGPGEAAILATFGYSEVPVSRKPNVAIFSTGSELLNVADALAPGRIRNSNSYMLAAQVEAAGGVPHIWPALPDDANQVQEALKRALTAADLVITSGGVSVGDYDVLVEVFGQWDGRLLFNKVAMRPGTPTSAALWQDKLLLALSGNPGASYVGFELFAKPLLKAMLGCAEPCAQTVSAYLDADYGKASAYPRYVRGTMRIREGQLWVKPAGIDKSSVMVSIKDADCLIRLPAGGQGFQRGELVKIDLVHS